MRISGLFFTLFRFLLPPAIIGALYLYLYPIILDCSFPEAKNAQAACAVPGKQKDAVPAEIAPFRLLAIGDPQLEGDTSLPDPNAPLFPSLKELGRRVNNGDWNAIVPALRTAAQDLFEEDVPRVLQGYRKKLDLWGNDLYLAHIYHSVSWWSQPTHTVVLGDLLGSQWIGDEEFRRRSKRFWNRVFKGAQKVPRSITDTSGRGEVLGQDVNWQRRLIAVAGNHDIGYAGDIDEHRIERFDDMYGSVNWEVRFRLENGTSQLISPLGEDSSPLAAKTPELHLVILNSMNLDSPAWNENLQQQSREFAEAQLHHYSDEMRSKSATILLTHIPFHKEPGVCVDAPFVDYFPPHQGGGIKEQNHLSKDTTDYLLHGLANDQRSAIVLNGHDHEGCDTYHYLAGRSSHPNSDSSEENDEDLSHSGWEARPYPLTQSAITNDSVPAVREITVRSMMGSFGGNVGFLSAWFDRDTEEWKFEYSSCMLGVQHIWWAVHVLDLIVLSLGVGGLCAVLLEERGSLKGEDLKLSNSKIKRQ